MRRLRERPPRGGGRAGGHQRGPEAGRSLRLDRLYEPDEALLKEVQAGSTARLAIEDAHLAHSGPSWSATATRSSSRSGPRSRIASSADRFGETHLFVGSRYVSRFATAPPVLRRLARAREAQPQLSPRVPASCSTPSGLRDGPVLPDLDGLEDSLEARRTRSSTSASAATPPCGSTLKRDLLEIKRASPRSSTSATPDADRSRPDPDTPPYFRDVYDTRIRINEMVDGLRELWTALEANLS